MVHNPLSWGAWLPVLSRQPPGVTDVALTFDDGPTPETTPRLIELLDRAGAKATFFLSGVRAVQHPELVGALAAAGHDIFAHGWEHEHYPSPAEAVGAMCRCEEVLAGYRPTPEVYFVRFPFNGGVWNPRMHRAVLSFSPHAQFAYVSHSTVDYAIAACCRTREEIEAASSRAGAALESDLGFAGAIILLHESPFGMPADFAGEVASCLTDRILKAVAAKGLQTGKLRPVRSRTWRSRMFLHSPRVVELWQPPRRNR